MSDEIKEHKNREARTFAFQFLYHFQWEDFFEDAKTLQESLESDNESQVDKEIMDFRESVPAPFETDVYDFSQRIIKGVLLKAPLIEHDLENYSKNWKLSRMSKVDLTLLKMGIFELEHMKETPKKVVINEILELAKKFSAAKSTNFINGILDQVSSKA